MISDIGFELRVVLCKSLQLGMFCGPLMAEKRAPYPPQNGGFTPEKQFCCQKTTEAAGKA